MFEVLFLDKRDAESFYIHTQLLLNSFVQTKKQMIDDKEYHVVSVSIFDEAMLKKLSDAFYLFIMNFKLDHWIAKKIREEFYFEDEMEIEQITDIAFEIIEGKRKDLQVFIEEPFSKEDLQFVVKNMLQDSIHFSFDSFVMFRMKKFFEQLDYYVEVAIDEYKLEQEYQMFIEMLRGFLDGRSSLFHTVNIKIDEEITILDNYMYEIRRSELMRLIDKKLLLQHPIYIDSHVIAPLLSVAPKRIYIYSDDYSQSIIQTIMNIFQERVQLRSLTDYEVQRRIIRQNFNEKI